MICYHGTVKGSQILRDRILKVTSNEIVNYGPDFGSLQTTNGRIYLGRDFNTAMDYAIRGYANQFEEKLPLFIFKVDTLELPVYEDPDADDDEQMNCSVTSNLYFGKHILAYKIINIEGVADGYHKLDTQYEKGIEWISVK